MWLRGLWTALAGGITVALWQVFSWTFLPWHCATMNQFQSEAEVAYIIRQNALKDGIYILPSVRCHLRGMREEWGKIYIQQGKEAMTQGPVMFAAIALKGTHDIGIIPYIYELLFWSLCALIIAHLLTFTRPLTYKEKVWFISFIGFLGGSMGYFILWNWEAFSLSFFLVHATDILIGWILAGFIMAALIRPPNKQNKEVL